MVSVVLMGSLLMPLVNNALKWWLEPAQADAARTTIIGTVLIFVPYLVALVAFSAFP